MGQPCKFRLQKLLKNVKFLSVCSLSYFLLKYYDENNKRLSPATLRIFRNYDTDAKQVAALLHSGIQDVEWEW